MRLFTLRQVHNKTRGGRKKIFKKKEPNSRQTSMNDCRGIFFLLLLPRPSFVRPTVCLNSFRDKKKFMNEEEEEKKKKKVMGAKGELQTPPSWREEKIKIGHRRPGGVGPKNIKGEREPRNSNSSSSSSSQPAPSFTNSLFSKCVNKRKKKKKRILSLSD